ncbi:uncharacterized protein LOC126559127 [Anopheles maculipalpis]|uniref:uncharacterized protein LOC126559127 n=1 Tax=Anopheles maculipalpis TaxID=1496333 RepID=UPI002159076A|nr:uncharacterized protein LOC126559127 [Anopheles maculipalpis]
MEPSKKPYEGLKCEDCSYWFSKMYLFKQHFRRCHTDLGELIDLPPLPFLVETVSYNQLEDELWFALLHTTPMQPILMRIFEAESHATMRIANINDIREQTRRVSKKTTERDVPTLPILYDIYTELRAGGKQSFYAVPKLKPPVEFPHHDVSSICSVFFRCSDLFEGLEPELPEIRSCLLDEITLFNEGLSNPLVNALEALVNEL